MSYDDHDRCRRCGGIDDGHPRIECDRRNAARQPLKSAVFPTPAELRSRIELEDSAAVQALTESLAAHLTREWTPSGRAVTAALGKEPQRVVETVVARLAASGWRATYHDDQREGRWLSIEAM